VLRSAGVLLVATEGLERSVFRRSVVLVTHSGIGGARGVMLTQVGWGGSEAAMRKHVDVFFGHDDARDVQGGRRRAVGRVWYTCPTQ
jgi:hypothetical protein